MKRIALIAAALSLWAGTAAADTVVLKNGDRLTGTVDSIAGGRLLLVTEYAGNVPIKLDQVAEVVSEAAFDVRTSDGAVSGTFSVANGAQQIVTDTGAVALDLGTVRSAGQDKLALASLGTDWSSRADLSAIISNGNSDTESYNTLIESVLKRETVEHALSLLVSNEKAEEERTKDQLDIDYGYKRFVSEKWFASGNAEYFQDRLKDIDQRITLGAGMGYQFWDDSFGAFSTDVTVNYVQEELDGEDETNPAVRWGLDYNRWLLAKKLEFFHNQSVLFIPDGDRGEVIESSTGLRYALNDRIDAAARVDVNHETEPPPGTSKTDVTYTLGIGIKF